MFRFTIPISLVLLLVSPARSQPQSDTSKNLPFEVWSLLNERPSLPFVRAKTPSAEGPTVPSLWWTDQQFGQQVVVDWRAYSANDKVQRQINVIVVSELWASYSYLDRFSFVTRFGTIASEQGYHLLVLNAQDFPLGAYTCTFEQSSLNHLKQLNIPEQSIFNVNGSNVENRRPCRLWLNANISDSSF